MLRDASAKWARLGLGTGCLYVTLPVCGCRLAPQRVHGPVTHSDSLLCNVPSTGRPASSSLQGGHRRPRAGQPCRSDPGCQTPARGLVR